MRKVRKLSFEELVRENKEEILNDEQRMEQLEERWEKRHLSTKS
ncbi:acid-soluble spore protein N [Alkalihalobacillus alcalophilus ATCC 27647 = CGMCC 1.3604]|uniref:Acid-soluble spore protein N n=1 Tax=Alkalihalobacillus alcalophilus ATCC 27647 = CGMCC 1.3604 TaxID=1218173 RepID=A0A4V3X8S8_ALKAL|nr:FbpB family small basic protein [Alkalihalobacillus alcalophilus]MED1562792.1 FbpB family small basic protein [Alkalihalobacillus alcalophilus]THG91522.1 acid-soluble spore protein N [Alkalihalobacillus alcalophilus ATCC 27647 = CGMCC 1.3604]